MLTIKKIEFDRKQIKAQGGWQVLVTVEASFGTEVQEIPMAIPTEMVESMLGGLVDDLAEGATKAVIQLVNKSTEKVV